MLHLQSIIHHKPRPACPSARAVTPKAFSTLTQQALKPSCLNLPSPMVATASPVRAAPTTASQSTIRPRTELLKLEQIAMTTNGSLMVLLVRSALRKFQRGGAARVGVKWLVRSSDVLLDRKLFTRIGVKSLLGGAGGILEKPSLSTRIGVKQLLGS